MKATQKILFLLLVFSAASCNFTPPAGKKKHCGYELTQTEFASIKSKMERQPNPYDADTSDIYDQLNHSIRATMPDSVEFEVFLTLLNKTEVAVDVAIPPNPAYYDRIGCAVMNTKYSDKMPEQRYLFLSTYTNLDGSGDVPLAFVIKRKE
jgi:hypothetical protein